MALFNRNKILLFLFLFPFILYSQSTYEDRIVDLVPGEYNIPQTLTLVGDLNNISIAYNSNQLDTTTVFRFRRDQYLLKDVLDYILSKNPFTVITYNQDRLVLRINASAAITISGLIFDELSKEPIAGALIEDLNSGDFVFSNENGFYSMELQPGNIQLNFRYLGYESHFVNERILTSRPYDIGLNNNNELTQVLITSDMSEGLPVRNTGFRINPGSIESFGSIAGVDDLINRIRYLPGVQSGNEGVGGLYVRGGSTDQNLYLYDGVPMYEISHTAGISSIYNNASIQNIDIYKSGFPARYAGRLSSIVDVKLKEGDQQEIKSRFSIGNYGPTLDISGPVIRQKLTFNLAARTSWMHWYINPLVGDVIDYDDVDIRFTDLNLKWAWNINSKHKITLTNYYGKDVLGLNNETTNLGGPISFRLRENNSIRWNSFLTSINYVATLNDKVQLSIHGGHLIYDYQNRGAYSFRNFSLTDPFVDEIDVISKSSIDDLMGGLKLDYYINDAHFLSFGGNISSHRIKPTLRQSTILLGSADVDQIGDNAEAIDATITSGYIQHKFSLMNDVQFDYGVNITRSSVRDAQYVQLQPRFSSSLRLPGDYLMKFSYSRMGQFMHLLVNPGLGLPSNLWVPSTENVRPETSDQINLSLNKRLTSNIKVRVDGFYKLSDGLVEYLLADGLYSTILNDNGFVPIFNEDKDWENNIETGSGVARGLEFYLDGLYKSTNFWLSYSLSKSTRQFDEINDGLSFPYKYDRRHDINVGMVSRLSTNKTIGLNWVYGSGTAFTLALESFPSVDGIQLLNPGRRNNYRLPAFHHLDVFYEYQNRATNTPFSIKVGIYNVYNQLNPYYVILYNDPVQNRPILKQVSIFPIFPYVIFKTDL